jgi:hypothetical protein
MPEGVRPPATTRTKCAEERHFDLRPHPIGERCRRSCRLVAFIIDARSKTEICVAVSVAASEGRAAGNHG